MKTAYIIITIGLVVALGVLLVGSGGGKQASGNNVEIRDGVQYVTIEARGGYFPKVSVAQAGIPTKLIIQTNNTFDCSSALVIRSAGFQEILPQTGKTEIDLGTPKAGEPIQGVCGMGMYSFKINFL